MKAAPCLASGNVIIVKPSEKSPLGSLAIAPLFEEAGFPKGVVQVLAGDGSTGALVAKHMGVRKVYLKDSGHLYNTDILQISFTGSVATGKKIQVMAAESNLKRVTLELGWFSSSWNPFPKRRGSLILQGGKSPAIIFEDADIQNALTW